MSISESESSIEEEEERKLRNDSKVLYDMQDTSLYYELLSKEKECDTRLRGKDEKFVRLKYFSELFADFIERDELTGTEDGTVLDIDTLSSVYTMNELRELERKRNGNEEKKNDLPKQTMNKENVSTVPLPRLVYLIRAISASVSNEKLSMSDEEQLLNIRRPFASLLIHKENTKNLDKFIEEIRVAFTKISPFHDETISSELEKKINILLSYDPIHYIYTINGNAITTIDDLINYSGRYLIVTGNGALNIDDVGLRISEREDATENRLKINENHEWKMKYLLEEDNVSNLYRLHRNIEASSAGMIIND
ncbi:hypothetical protein SNEBB_002218 [Seison nebaliae]|nr:hypothetical protein SNEBB_002218 [Seison nebaliae]